MKKIFLVLLTAITSLGSFAQEISTYSVEPPFWWAGMANENLQLMIKGENIGLSTIEVKGKGVKLVKQTSGDSPNYTFIDLVLEDEIKPQTIDIITINQQGNKEKIAYELTARTSRKIKTVDNGDAVYLITPDRFANGDPGNDDVEGMREVSHRSFRGGRHGGDLNGIISNLDYLEELGVTALWISPMLENDMPEYSYHGYAITDFYLTDPRFGSNEQYKSLSDKLHSRDMKLVMDMVFNHCGLSHSWMEDKPFKDWVHDYESSGVTNYAISAYSDPYAAASDIEKMEKGWFVPSMPDLNHDNPFMATYLIQNSIWWIEYAGLDGIRMDTHPYNKPEVMQQWADRVLEEYPGFYLLGETWVNDVSLEAYWSKRSSESSEFNSGLTSITDFPVCFSIHKAFGKEGDVRRLYDVLSQDFVYDEPFSNTIFAGNHDMDRLYHNLDQRLDKYKLALTFLLTTRGIPQLYYGDEILMAGHGPHGIIREDFPGGWEGDSLNAFNVSELSGAQKEAFEHTQKLLRFRKKSEALRNGALKHLIPTNNVYIYMRKTDEESVLVMMNNSESEATILPESIEELIGSAGKGTDIINGNTTDLNREIIISPNSSVVLLLDQINTRQ
ncbi:glycoside hydrolase family 13 protein [Marinoscillum sp. MHG1-6]|uniref:glycoside hydrolase family 13 protein n=1 Tax=Marinoscillum sp. MHG1-6 TaxID=2959627 RepID=UPI00215838CD|nr:glycoside hydrolase family 13 protein [Marinoscillum sp. MHG1-6]